MHPDKWLGTWEHMSRRYRSAAAYKKANDKEVYRRPLPTVAPVAIPFPTADNSNPAVLPHTRSSETKINSFRPKTATPRVGIPVISQDKIIPYFEANASTWAFHPLTENRLASFGLPTSDSKLLLSAFVDAIESGSLSDSENFSYYGLERFARTHTATSIDIIYSTIFFAWASNPDVGHQQQIEEDSGALNSTMTHIRQLAQATDRQFPADEFHRAREIRRKVIMHVGPTNSGKTHHALRALAAAKTGVYAGPLRLLAHEIWERLNTGQIVPLGAEEEPVKKVSKVDSTIGIVPSQTTVRRVGNPKYARLCNMVTGEEQKLMGADVPLLSCTVEMLSFTQTYDVAVVDEIQMVGDLERGGGWVNAVLGLSAHELHLCGEETAVPIVEALLRDTGDELVVRRYERLTPLVVEAESLGGDLTKIKKGDCIVTFTRSNIFGIKRAVEEKTGMRCAVVYGRLPPEVRSEQAALFNDPDSGYDVIIGSDAIGMGLNLKIKRVVFEAVSKFSLTGHKRLAVSQVKQIAGRAGRYGLHQDGEAGGLTTTLHAPDLAYLRECVATPFTPLQSCRIGFTRDTFEQVSSALPMDASIDTVIDAHRYIGRIPSFLQYSTVDQSKSACDYINREWSDMSSGDRIMLMFAPIPWRDEMAAEFIRQILRVHRNQMSVDFMGAVKNTHFIEVMKLMEERMSKDDPPRSTTDGLMVLESLHKVIVMYIWMSFRNPVVYAQYEEVAELKTRLEAVLNWCLEGITQQGKTYWPTKKIHRPMDSFSVQTKRHMIIKENEKRQAASPRPRFGIKNPVSHAA